MQFKYPEILYALFLLLIPIIVHLFQLQRFEKVAFTNVKFLKKIELQTRKSSQLKKFLILLSRLLLFASFILAFAQPFFSKNKVSIKPQTLLYLDNSLSMQAKDGSNELFKKAIQDIISKNTFTDNISVLTNDNFYTDLSGKDLKNQLLSLDYHPIPQDINTVLLKAKKSFKQQSNTKNHFILVSDFQKNNIKTKLKLDSTIHYSFVQTLPQKKENIAIDSIYISSQNGQKITLKVILKSHQAKVDNLSVSLLKENILLGKSSISLEKNKVNTAQFTFPFNETFNGKIIIEDHLIPFDNTFYFSMNSVEKINVLAIGNNNKFLSKIYTTSEFNFIDLKQNQIDYNKILNQHLIVLNELEDIPNSLQNVLKDFVFLGGSLVIIPNQKSEITNYNQFFNNLHIGSIKSLTNNEHKITSINFSHPILNGVFEKQVKNFQYPNIKSSFPSALRNTSPILKFDNQQPFISQSKGGKGRIYWIAAPINQKNSNFKNSPLIVPVFYNFGKQSYQVTELFYTIGKENIIEVQTDIKKDEVLEINKSTAFGSTKNSFIPVQQVNHNKVTITTDEKPLLAYHYQISKQGQTIKNIAYNYDRKEGVTEYNNLKNTFKNNQNVTVSSTIEQAFNQINNQYKSKSLWKWFVGLALLFLFVEILLIKFMKG